MPYILYIHIHIYVYICVCVCVCVCVYIYMGKYILTHHTKYKFYYFHSHFTEEETEALRVK